MASPDRLSPSPRLRAAASADVARVRRQLVRLDASEASLRAELRRIQEARRDAQEHLQMLMKVAGEPAADGSFPRLVDRAASHEDREPPRLVNRTSGGADARPLRVLRGREARIAAVQCLRRALPPDTPVHYKEWLDLLNREGVTVAGRDAAASLLTQIGRSPVVRRADAPGTYTIDVHAVSNLSARVDELRGDLIGLNATADSTDLDAIRRTRGGIITELHRAEALLAEAQEALDAAPSAASSTHATPSP